MATPEEVLLFGDKRPAFECANGGVGLAPLGNLGFGTRLPKSAELSRERFGGFPYDFALLKKNENQSSEFRIFTRNLEWLILLFREQHLPDCLFIRIATNRFLNKSEIIHRQIVM